MPSTRPLQWIEQAEARQVITDALFRQAPISSWRKRLHAAIATRVHSAQRRLFSPIPVEWPMPQAQPVLVRRQDRYHRPVRYDDHYR